MGLLKVERTYDLVTSFQCTQNSKTQTSISVSSSDFKNESLFAVVNFILIEFNSTKRLKYRPSFYRFIFSFNS